MTSKEFGKLLQDKLTSEYGVELSVASNQQIYRSLALILRSELLKFLFQILFHLNTNLIRPF